MEKTPSRSLWFPLLLSVVIHVVLVMTFFQIRILGSVFFGDSLKRLPELERLAKADEERIERFIKETSELQAPADPTKMGGSEITGLEFSLYSPVTTERGLPELISPPIPDTAPTGYEKLIRDAERSATKPILPPSKDRPGKAGPKLHEKPGIPMKALIPLIPLDDLEAEAPKAATTHPAYHPAGAEFPVAPSPDSELPALPQASPDKKTWPLDDDIETNLTIYRDPVSGEDYFRLALKVREESELPVFAKDVLYLVDSSNSVKDSELRLVFDSVLNDVKALSPNDRFNVVKFHLREETLYLDFSPYRHADLGYIIDFLKRPERSVLTNLSNTIRRSLEKFPGEKNRPMNVVLFSDGKVTAGETGAAAVASRYSNALTSSHSILAMNIGLPVDSYMLEMMTFTGKGYYEHCEREHEAPKEIAMFLRRFSRPVLMNCEAQYVTPAVSDIYPMELPNLYRDNVLFVYGKCRKGGEFAVRLIGTGVNGPCDFFLRTALPEPDPEAYDVVKEWARGRIYQLTDEFFNRGGGEKALAEIRALSVRYGVGVPFDINR
ncbi:MAG: hypothetical protein Kow00107_03870 [Planctomycetota bacterium]